MTSQANEILAKIVHLQNGDVSTAMQNMGLNYKLNYGVSVVQLLEIAAQYNKNNELAYSLLSSDVREMKIIASLLFEHNTNSIDQLLSISTAIDNIELVEQFSKNLFSKTPDLDATLPILVDIDYWQQLVAMYSAAWHLKIQKDSNTEILNWSKNILTKYIESNDKFFQKAVVFLFQSLLRVNKETKEEMVALAEEWTKSEKIAVQEIAKELLWQIN